MYRFGNTLTMAAVLVRVAIGVRARLENGLSGFIYTRNLSDKHVMSVHQRRECI